MEKLAKVSQDISTTNEYFIASSLEQHITNIINLSSYEQTCLMRPH